MKTAWIVYSFATIFAPLQGADLSRVACEGKPRSGAEEAIHILCTVVCIRTWALLHKRRHAGRSQEPAMIHKRRLTSLRRGEKSTCPKHCRPPWDMIASVRLSRSIHRDPQCVSGSPDVYRNTGLIRSDISCCGPPTRHNALYYTPEASVMTVNVAGSIESYCNTDQSLSLKPMFVWGCSPTKRASLSARSIGCGWAASHVWRLNNPIQASTFGTS